MEALGAMLTAYVTSRDVRLLLGCKETHAWKCITEVNKYAKSRGLLTFKAGTANKYLFSEKFGIPMEVINGIIEYNHKEGESHEEKTVL